MNIIALELRKLGLAEKEVKVYLTGLELGPTSVQKISVAANLTRPTTYEIIEKLEAKGLFSEIKEKKKIFSGPVSGKHFGNIKNSKERD